MAGKAVLRIFAGAALCCSVAVQSALADSYAVDSAHSTTVFKINHFGISDFYGRFNDMSGTITYDKVNPEKSAVEVKIKADSVDTNNKKRDDHLRNPDFFNAKQFPTISFKSTAVKKVSDTEYEVAGDLSMHGVTKPITLKMKKIGEGTDPMGKERIGFNTEVTLKRSDFGMSFMPDKLGDDVTLMIGVEGVKG